MLAGLSRYRLIISKSLTCFLFFAILNFSLSSFAAECNRNNPENCLDGVGPAVFNSDNIRTTTGQLSRRLEDSYSEEEKNISEAGTAINGLSAGELIQGWGIWTSFNYADYGADIPINSTVQPVASYDADQVNFLFGVDRLFQDKFIIGLLAGYENTDINTLYNGGENDIDGYTLAPYFSYLINDNFSFDVSAGYSTLSYDTTRIDDVSGGTIFGEFDSDRWFFITNINAMFLFQNWYLNGRIGYLYTEESQEGYSEVGPNTARTITDRHIDLGQLSFAAELAYSLQNFEPYFNLTYINDIGRDNGASAGGLPGSVGRTQPEDDDEIQIFIGIRYFNNNISGSLEYGNVMTRETFDSQNLMFTFRYDF